MASQNRSALQATIDFYFPDNTTEEISPADARLITKNISDSSVSRIDDSYLRVVDASTGTEPAYVITLSNLYPSVYSETIPILFQAHATNTGAATLNINSIGAKNIRRPNGDATVAGDITSGQLYIVNYDSGGDEFLIVPGFGGGSALPSSSLFNHITGSGTVTLSNTNEDQIIDSGVTQVNLPASPTDGREYAFKNVSGGTVILSGNGKNIYTSSANATRNIINGASMRVKYDLADDIWYNKS